MARVDNLRIYYQNVRGLRTKTNTFFRNLMIADYDIICLTETWLLPGIYDAELFDVRYSIYRCDRDYAYRGEELGGGVLVAVHQRFTINGFSPIAIENHVADALTVSLFINKHTSLHIFCGYFPHCRQHSDALGQFFEVVSDRLVAQPHDKYLVVGDFNVSQAQWILSAEGEHYLDANSSDNLIQLVSSFLSYTDFKQYNNVQNVNNRSLDLIFSDSLCSVSRCNEPLVPEDDHHPALQVQFQLQNRECLTSAPRTIKLFRRADYEAINEAILAHDWTSLYSIDQVELALAEFYRVINEVISEYVPKLEVKRDSRYPPWFSRALIKIINEKLKFHKRWKVYGRLSDYHTFNVLRKRQIRVQIECYDKFIEAAEDNIHNDSKQFWSFVKSKKSSSELPKSVFLNDVACTDGGDISNLFNTYFQSVFEPNLSSKPPKVAPYKTTDNSLVSLDSVDISIDVVEKYLRDLDVSKGCGPDGIPAIFLKNCSSTLCAPLHYLFQLSLRSGNFPIAWKQSYIVPIHKTGDKHNVQNYRGISKINVIPKLFEKCVFDIIYPILSPIIIDQQHGFLKKKSTETNLCEFVHNVATSMDKGYQVDAVYTDFSKAFDKISHDLLICKLGEVGIHGDLLRWLESYLRDRSQAVVVKGFCSSFIPVTSGVPQGSHLGPLLFNLFINDIYSVIRHSNFILYADDMKIYKTIVNVSDCLLLQTDLNNLVTFCESNCLNLNIKKCCVISFTRKKKNNISYNYYISNESLNRVAEVRDLGVILDSKLSFNNHIEHITSKAYRMLGFILRISKDFKRCSTMTLLFNCFVRSILEYASVIWNPQYNLYIDSIERIYLKFVKHISYRCSHCSFKSDEIRSKSLCNRRHERDQVFLFKINNNMLDSSFLLSNIFIRCPRASSRNKKLFSFPNNIKTNYAANTFLYRACYNYNMKFDSIDLFNNSLNVYKQKIRNILNS